MIHWLRTLRRRARYQMYALLDVSILVTRDFSLPPPRDYCYRLPPYSFFPCTISSSARRYSPTSAW